METTIQLPRHLQLVTTQEIIDLKLAQHQARVDLRLNPFAWAMNAKWRRYFRQRKRLEVPNVIRFSRRGKSFPVGPHDRSWCG